MVPLSHIPDSCPAAGAVTRTTHLGIGAHQDDLEFMAYHGIVTCYEDSSNYFTGGDVHGWRRFLAARSCPISKRSAIH